MHLLLKGSLPLPIYAAMLRNLHALYEALEPALQRHQADACIARFSAPGLDRTPSLVADLEVLGPPGWRDALPLEPAAQRYATRLRALGDAGSRRLIAHAYVRYLGDLNGGQALKRLVCKQYGLAGDEGTAFYEFGSAENVAGLRHKLRTGLAEMRLPADEVDNVVAEACDAFVWHIELFEQLMQRHLPGGAAQLSG